METIIAVVSKCYSYSESNIIGYFSTKEKAIDFCKKDFERIKPQNLTELLPPDREHFKSYERFEYNSYYGGHKCGYELMPILVQ